MKQIFNNAIELLKRSESLALKYSDDGFYLAFSGGKDSQCLYHISQMAGVKFKAHMMLTSVDPPEVIRFVKKNYPDVVLHKPKDSIYNMAVKKKFLLPSRIIRWCCAELKETGGAGTVCLTGVRKAESIKRQKRNHVEVSNRSFSGNLDEFLIWQEQKIKDKIKHLNQDEYSMEKESEVRCIEGKDKIIINPIIDWSDNDVWFFLNKVAKVEHCQLYDEGFSRIGCILCPMATFNKKLIETKRYPHVKRCWIKVIKQIRADGIGKNILTDNYFGDGSEDEICEQIFNWWISGKSYEEWYAETYLQLKLFD